MRQEKRNKSRGVASSSLDSGRCVAALHGFVRSGPPGFSLETQSDTIQRMKSHGLEAVHATSADEIAFRCPEHRRRTGRDDKRPSASLNWRRGVWCCYGCGASGTASRLLGGRKPTPAETVRGLLERAKRPKPERTLVPADFRKLTRVNNYLRNRGLTDRDVRDWGLGVAGDYVIFPARVNRKLVGWQGRAMTYGREPRYCSAPGARDYVMGYDLAKRRGGPLVVVEGPFDAVRVWQAGWPVVALCGGGSGARYKLIATLAAKRAVIIMLDNDGAGARAANRTAAELQELGVVARSVDLPEGYKDPAEATPGQINAWIISLLPALRKNMAWARKQKGEKRG